MRLPASGREGPAPSWPLDESTPAELRRWERLWRTPQATVWEGLGWTAAVARYARVSLAAEAALTQHLMAESRQLEDRLGLSPKAMRMMSWVIEDDDATPAAVVTPGRWQETG